MLYTVSADALQGFRLMLDTPAHEGVERGRAAVQGGYGGPQRRADGRYEREAWRGWATGRTTRPVAPTRCRPPKNGASINPGQFTSPGPVGERIHRLVDRNPTTRRIGAGHGLEDALSRNHHTSGGHMRDKVIEVS